MHNILTNRIVLWKTENLVKIRFFVGLHFYGESYGLVFISSRRMPASLPFYSSSQHWISDCNVIDKLNPQSGLRTINNCARPALDKGQYKMNSGRRHTALFLLSLLFLSHN